MTGLSYILSISICVFAFIQDDGTRHVIPEEFVKSRPARSNKVGSASTAARRNSYRPASAKPATPGGKLDPSDAVQLGLTVWRLRPSIDTDSGARIIVHHDDETEEWTPERVASSTPLRMGERIRFSFEAPQTGRLYVIDREKYANGSTGEPFLIFPTTRTRNGDNQVAPGRVIEIPGQEDRPNFFTLRRSRLDQTGELLTVIVTPRPIEGLTIGDKPLQLSAQQVAEWEKQWGAMSERFEMAAAGKSVWTKAEQEAGADATRQLTQDDPGPQTIYRIAVKPGAPVLVNVGLRYVQGAAGPRKRSP
jgi:hypothetical protein